MESDWKKVLDEEVESLQKTRDELRVQLHLGAADARDAWGRLEKKWEHLEARLKRFGEVSHESADDVESAAKNLVGEIKQGYKRMRDVL